MIEVVLPIIKLLNRELPCYLDGELDDVLCCLIRIQALGIFGRLISLLLQGLMFPCRV